MRTSFKVALATVAGSASLAVCAASYDNGYYAPGYYSPGYYSGGNVAPYYDPHYVAPERRAYEEREARRRDREARRYGERRDGKRYEPVPLEAEMANREQDYLNQGRDGRGWSQDGSHSGG